MPPHESEFPCRTCRTPVSTGAPWFPFCSERCKMADLGWWLEERYRISSPLPGATGASEPEDEASADASSEESHDD